MPSLRSVLPASLGGGAEGAIDFGTPPRSEPRPLFATSAYGGRIIVSDPFEYDYVTAHDGTRATMTWAVAVGGTLAAALILRWWLGSGSSAGGARGWPWNKARAAPGDGDGRGPLLTRRSTFAALSVASAAFNAFHFVENIARPVAYLTPDWIYVGFAPTFLGLNAGQPTMLDALQLWTLNTGISLWAWHRLLTWHSADARGALTADEHERAKHAMWWMHVHCALVWTGLAHYLVAPITDFDAIPNLSILGEVCAAGLLHVVVFHLHWSLPAAGTVGGAATATAVAGGTGTSGDAAQPAAGRSRRSASRGRPQSTTEVDGDGSSRVRRRSAGPSGTA